LWACRGKTYADIALITGLSPGSIKSYLDTARHKLCAVNLPQACAIAAEGIFTSEEILNRPTGEEALSSDPASAPPPRQNQP
jgi:hypothetical protein